MPTRYGTNALRIWLRMDVRKAFAVFKDFDEFDGQYKKMKEHDYSPMFIRHAFTIYIDPYSEESSDEAFAGWRLLKE